MSWYAKATGFPKDVHERLEVQFASQKCCEPEETARQAARVALLAIVDGYPDHVKLIAQGMGSQNGPEKPVVGSLSVRVEAIEDF